MNLTIPQIQTTAASPAPDDFVELGGRTRGSRKFPATSLVLTTDPRLTGGTVTSVQTSGGSTGLLFSGGPVTTAGTFTLSGTLLPGFGGTGLHPTRRATCWWPPGRRLCLRCRSE